MINALSSFKRNWISLTFSTCPGSLQIAEKGKSVLKEDQYTQYPSCLLHQHEGLARKTEITDEADNKDMGGEITDKFWTSTK